MSDGALAPGFVARSGDMTDVEKILEFLEEEAEDLPDGFEITAETSLFRDQLLDSMSLTSLITFLEDEFSIRVGPMDIVFENLDTVNHMVAFIERKRSA
jgi:acyl carrier protein